MTFERVKGIDDRLHSKSAQQLMAPGLEDRHEARPAVGFIVWLQQLAARRRANALLRRLLGKRTRTPIDELSPHLLRDIGLPPDVRR